MRNKVLATMHELWIESEEYYSESALESEKYRRKMEEIIGIVGEKKSRDISDHITNMACDVETVGFEQGFRRGVLFMAEMIKSGSDDA